MSTIIGWNSIDDMLDDFGGGFGHIAPPAWPEGATLLLAVYDRSGWEGYAFILWEQAGKLYEVNASHCSCNGLEGQWGPEETTWDALRLALDRGGRLNQSALGSEGAAAARTLIEAHSHALEKT